MRRLDVTFAGYWYTALTIGLGVVALSSGNNVLYLIESLLLSGMIFSGVLSEGTISAVELGIHRARATAGDPLKDRIRVRNRKRYPLFCVEVGEWVDGKFTRFAFIPKLSGWGSVQLQTTFSYPRRGVHRWQGLAIATSYPFGLVKKIRIIDAPGERTIWPEYFGNKSRKAMNLEKQGYRGSNEFTEGEIRPYAFGDDYRMIVWAQSQKGIGPMVRPRSGSFVEPRVSLDLRKLESMDEKRLEKEISSAATSFHKLADSASEQSGVLTLISKSGHRQVFRGKVAALNELAIIGVKIA